VEARAFGRSAAPVRRRERTAPRRGPRRDHRRAVGRRRRRRQCRADRRAALRRGDQLHWFRADEALLELHRVLRPGSGLALIWNTIAPGALAGALEGIVSPRRPGAPSFERSSWREELETSGLLVPL